MKPTILIAGATGATGNVATKLLLEKAFPVRAFVHKDDERAQKLKALGAETFVGELLDFRAVRRAFEGIKRAYFVYPIRPGIVQATAQYAQAALEAKAEFIVNLSQRTARPDALSDRWSRRSSSACARLSENSPPGRIERLRAPALAGGTGFRLGRHAGHSPTADYLQRVA